MEEENEKIKANELDNSFLYETRYSHWQALTNKLCDLCTRYRTAKLKHKKNEEQQTISQYLIEYPGLSVDEIKQKIRENEEKGIDHKLGEVSLATRNVYSKAEQRNKEVTRIANEISELCILIDELHEMVKGQRGRIDKIEVHTAASVASTGRAKKSLKNALDYQIAATRIKRIILAIVSIIILALVGYFGYKLFKNNNNNGSDKKDDKPTE